MLLTDHDQLAVERCRILRTDRPAIIHDGGVLGLTCRETMIGDLICFLAGSQCTGHFTTTTERSVLLCPKIPTFTESLTVGAIELVRAGECHWEDFDNAMVPGIQRD